MRVAILCPGPSLAKWHEAVWLDYAVRIGVNRAAHRTRCTHWIFGDSKVFTEWPIDYPAQVWTQAEQLDAILSTEHDPGPHAWHVYPELYDRYPCVMDGMTWPTFTLPAAYILAASLGAKTIDVYGDDRTNAPDFDGQNHHDARGEHRWSDQTAFERPVIQRLASEGIRINRL